MPIQAPSWTDFLICPVCCNEFAIHQRVPISLGCGHTICRLCLATIHNRQCPFDQASITTDVDSLPANHALLQLVNNAHIPPTQIAANGSSGNLSTENKTTVTTSKATTGHNNSNTRQSGCGEGGSTNGTDVGNAEDNKSAIGSNTNELNDASGGSSVDDDGGGGDGVGVGVGVGIGGESCSTTAHTSHMPASVKNLQPDDLDLYRKSKKCIETLALHLKSFMSNATGSSGNGGGSTVGGTATCAGIGSTSGSGNAGGGGNLLSRPMQRKLVTLINCQLMEEEGRVRVLRAARSLGERTVTELILQHQNPQQLSSNLWAAVRSRGCQFLGHAMQEEVLKLVLLALENGTALSRKVLVMFVVQRLEPQFPQASKTSIGHVVQLLYRASCFKVSKREADSSLMQLKEEFRTYDALRREHDAQIVQIATEAGLRIAPDQWSSLLYGDTQYKSHMQSIIDKLQTPSSFAQSVQELVIALQRTGDPANLISLRPHLRLLADIDQNSESLSPTWADIAKTLESVCVVINGLVDFVQHHGNRKLQENAQTQHNTNTKYKISLCRDLTERRICPRGSACTFAHSEEELERYRKNRKNPKSISSGAGSGVVGIGGIANAASLGSNSNPITSKKDYTQQHGKPLLNPRDDKSSPVSTATSPLRFSTPAHAKLKRNAQFDSASPLHPPPAALRHMGPMHHSPISPKNGVRLGGVGGGVPPQLPINVSPTTHRFEAPVSPYGPINFVPPQIRMVNMGMNGPGPGPPPPPARNAGEQLSPRHHIHMGHAMGPGPPSQPPQQQQQQKPQTPAAPTAAMMSTANPPNFQGNNVSSLHRNPMNTKSLYGTLATATTVELLNVLAENPSNVSLFGNTTKMHNNSDLNVNGVKMRPHSNPLWDPHQHQHQHQPHQHQHQHHHHQHHHHHHHHHHQQQQQQQHQLIMSSLDLLGQPNQNSYYSRDASYFLKKPHNLNMDLSPLTNHSHNNNNNNGSSNNNNNTNSNSNNNNNTSGCNNNNNICGSGNSTTAQTSTTTSSHSSSSSNTGNGNSIGSNTHINANNNSMGEALLFKSNYAGAANSSGAPTFGVSLPLQDASLPLIGGPSVADSAMNPMHSINSINQMNAINTLNTQLAQTAQTQAAAQTSSPFWSTRGTTGPSASCNTSFVNYRENRDNFVRSDSILDDDASTTFDVPVTGSSALGNKYGPICPMYKGHNAIASTSSPSAAMCSYIDSWMATPKAATSQSISSSSSIGHERDSSALLSSSSASSLAFTELFAPNNDTLNMGLHSFGAASHHHHHHHHHPNQHQHQQPSGASTSPRLVGHLGIESALKQLELSNSSTPGAAIIDATTSSSSPSSSLMVPNENGNFQFSFIGGLNITPNSGLDTNGNRPISLYNKKESLSWKPMKSTGVVDLEGSAFWKSVTAATATGTVGLTSNDVNAPCRSKIDTNGQMTNAEISDEKYDRGVDIEKELAEIVQEWTTDDSGIKLD